MAKTRSQTRNITIKKEEEDHKDIQLLHSVNNTGRNSRKITKRKASRSKNNLPAHQVKVEEETDTKSPLKTSPESSKGPKEQRISQQQIKQLIDYIVNHGINVAKAARKANINCNKARRYYNTYKNDPEKKIPVPKEPISQEQIKQFIHYVVNDKMSVLKASKKANVSYDKARHYYITYKYDPEKKIPEPKDNRNICTQEQITTLITSIVDGCMTLLEASAKANMSYSTGRIYYRKYKENQNLNIPMKSSQRLMQERITKLIGYLADGKMSVKDASAKVNMDYGTAIKYYHKYLNDPNHDIPVADPHAYCVAFPIQDQVNSLISFIVDEKMKVVAASRRANMTLSAGWKYYRKYKDDPNHRIPVVCKSKPVCTIIPQDKIKQLIHYITKDKMSIRAASRKANMSLTSGQRYYQKCRSDPNSIITTPSQSVICTQEQINKLIVFIVDDKMTVKDASAKANMSLKTGKKYYQQYRNDLHHNIPTPAHIVSRRRYTEEQVNTFIRYIVHDKMSINAASIKANMDPDNGRRHYKRYINDPNNVIPTHIVWRSPPTQEQVTDLIRYIFEDKMSIYAASKKAKMGLSTASKYYHQYINDTNSEAPTHIRNRGPRTQDQIDNLIHYIVEDKMSISAASKKVRMHYETGYKYYTRYLRDRQ